MYFIRRCWFLKCSEEIHYVPIGNGDMWYYVPVDDGWEEVLGHDVYITSQYSKCQRLNCIVQESNPGRLRGRRALYLKSYLHCKKSWRKTPPAWPDVRKKERKKDHLFSQHSAYLYIIRGDIYLPCMFQDDSLQCHLGALRKKCRLRGTVYCLSSSVFCTVYLCQYSVHLRQYCVFLRQYCVKLRQYCVFLQILCN